MTSLLALMEEIVDLKESVKQKQIILWTVMVAIYFIYVNAMLFWQNKLISHIFMAKFFASLLASLVKLLNHFVTKKVFWIMFTFIENSMIVIEQFITLILFFELYMVICKMERREYKLNVLLKKIGLACIVGSIYGSLFTGVELHYAKYKSSYVWIDDICLSALIMIPLNFCFVKVMITLVKNGKFNKQTLVKNHFIIHLMIVLFLVQISKLVSFTMNFYFEHDIVINECEGNINTSVHACIIETAKLIWGSMMKESYFSTQFCSLWEGLYIVVIMILKNTSCGKLCCALQ